MSIPAGLRRTPLRFQLQLPARGLPRRGTGGARGRTGLLQRWRSPTNAASPAVCARTSRRARPAAEADPRHRTDPGLRHEAGAAGLQPRRLRQPRGAGHAGSAPGGKGQLPPVARRPRRLGRRRRARLPGLLWVPVAMEVGAGETAIWSDEARWLAEHFAGRAWIAWERHLRPDDGERLAALRELAATLRLPLLAAGDVHMHVRSRRPLQDALTALRLKTTVARPAMRCLPTASATCARAWRSGAPLSARAAGRDPGGRRALRILARRAALRVPRGSGAGRRDAGFLAAPADRGRPRAALPGRRAGQGGGPGRARAGADRRDALRAVFPHRARHRRLGARAGASCARGAARRRIRRCATRSSSPRSTRRAPHAVRALRLEGAQRAARHRRRFRAPAARGGDPVHLRQIRPRARRAGRGRDHLPHARCAARRRARAGLSAGGDRRPGRQPGLVGKARGAAGALRRVGLDPADAAVQRWLASRRC
jgi:hypothetical protein